MSVLSKIIFGLLATTALAWWLSGPMKLGEQCRADRGTTAAAKPSDAAAPTALAAQAAPVAVSRCQSAVDQVFKGKSISFASGGTAIAVGSEPLVSMLAESLRSCDQVIVEVAGHTDAKGDAAINLRLSEERANAVVQALMIAGVPGDRLLPKGYGETQRLDQSDSEAAHASNRRIEFRVSPAPATAGS